MIGSTFVVSMIKQKMKSKEILTQGIKYFLQGLLITAPIAITMYVIYQLFTSIDSWLPINTYKDEQGNIHVRNYGLGLILILAAIILIGYFGSFLLKSRAFNVFDNWLEKTPGIKLLYGTTKDFFSAFAGNKKKFNKPVLASIENEDVYRIGFITETDLRQFGLQTHVAVYLPAAYSISGYVYLVPISRVRQVDGVTAADAMKFAISGGVSDVDDEENSIDKK
jgi:uncharacterized membrane protein